MRTNHFWKQAIMACVLLFILLPVAANAQTKPVQNNVPPCFCCESINAYQLTPPVITGPDPLCACPPVIYSIVPCPGASITWTVVDNLGNAVTFTGQSTASITLTLPLAATATSVTITVKISCKDKFVQTQKIVKIKPKPNPCFPYSITNDGNGGFVINATGNVGYPNAWRITQIVPDNTPCSAWAYGPVLFPDQAIQNATWSGALLPGKTYRIIHWVENCSPTYIASDCRGCCWVCFTITPSALVAPSGTPTGNLKSKTAFPKKGTKVDLMNVSVSPQIDVLTDEMKKELKK